MTSTENISSWLNDPSLITEDDAGMLRELLRQFPYFFPLHYLKPAAAREATGISGAVRELYPANPVLLHHWLYGHIAESGTACPAPEKEATGDQHNSAQKKAEQPAYAFDERTLLQEQATGKDYFATQGIDVPSGIPEENTVEENTGGKDLMVVMRFSEWLQYLQDRTQKAREEEADKKALKAMWQKQKLAAAIEEEEEEIPETVFEMAVNSIAVKEEFISESLAEVYAKQGKKEKAIALYRKLSLLNPEKNAYFAQKIESLQKEI